MEQLYSLGEVARLLDMQRHRITYAISTGAVADVTHRVANMRCFTVEDIQRVAAHFGVESEALKTAGSQGGE